MIKKLLAFVLLSISVFAWSQQIPMYNQYHIAPRVYNPSYTGFNEGVNIALVRNQKWGDYDEGYITNYLSASYLLADQHGLGINLYSDVVGITSKLKAHLLYSYKLQLADKIFLRAGAGLGVVDNRVDFANATVTDPNDPVLSNTGKARRTMFDMNVGVNLQVADFRFGISVPQVLGSKLVYGDTTISYYTLERQFLSNIGYTWNINDDMSLRPEGLVMFTPGAPFQYNAGLFFEMKKYFWVGGMYKSDYAVGINVGVNLVKNLKIGLAYDFQIGSIASYNSAPNGELLLRYNIPPSFKEVEATDPFSSDSLIAQNDSLKQIIRNKNGDINDRDKTIKVLEDSLAKWPDEVVREVPDKEDTTESKGVKTNSADHFIELNGEDTPNGYYVIGGAFAEKSNADRLVRKIKSKFPSARIIKNKRNSLYYVMLYYSTKKGEGLAYASYKANQLPDEDTWILYYNRQ